MHGIYREGIKLECTEGGVRADEIPTNYPEQTENYWPDWSRCAFADIRRM